MLHLLECALALDKHRNYARAAEQLRISQPTLTRSIQELERQIGAKLFDRSRRGVEPTTFGKIALKSARRVATDIADLKREIALVKGLDLGELTVGVGPIVAQTWMGTAVGAFLAKHPKLFLQIRDLDWWDISGALHERRIDLAIGETQNGSEDPTIAIEPLPHRQICFYSRTNHPLLRLKRATIRDLGEFPFVAPKLPKRVAAHFKDSSEMGQMAENGHYFEPRVQCQNLDAILRVVAGSDAVGFATAATLEQMMEAGGVAVVPFQAPWLQTNYGIMHLKERTLTPAALAFCAEVRDAESRYNKVQLKSEKKSSRRQQTL